MVESSHTAGFWPQLTEPFRSLGARVADWFAPASEASRQEDAYEIDMELPGVKAEDIDVSVHDGTMVIKGEKRSERTEEGRTFFFSERQYGSFQRSFRLPPDADADAVSADFRDGVLSIRVPRKDRNSGGRKVEINRS